MCRSLWIFVATIISVGSSLKAPLDLQLDIEDILRADLMPTTFLMFDGGFTGADSVSSRVGEDDLFEIPSVAHSHHNNPGHFEPLVAEPSPSDGNIKDALSTMRFHR